MKSPDQIEQCHVQGITNTHDLQLPYQCNKSRDWIVVSVSYSGEFIACCLPGRDNVYPDRNLCFAGIYTAYAFIEYDSAKFGCTRSFFQKKQPASPRPTVTARMYNVNSSPSLMSSSVLCCPLLLAKHISATESCL